MKCPTTLSKLVDSLNRFRNTNIYKNDFNYDKNVNSNSLCRGVSAKKMHEITLMVPFVRYFCEKTKCKCLIDVGSGLVGFCFINYLHHLDRFTLFLI